MMLRSALLLAPLVLMACADPATRCSRQANADLIAIDAQIVQMERDVARGYRFEPEQEPETIVKICNWPKDPVLFCAEQVRPARSARRVTITPEQGERDLAALRAERALAAPKAAQALAQCSV
jgi:hypothetical protein